MADPPFSLPCWVIVKRMEDFLVRKKRRMSWWKWKSWRRTWLRPTYVQGTSWTSWPGRHVIVKGAEGFVSVRKKKGTLVANVRQYAMLREREDEEYHELHEVIEYMNERQEKLLFTMERKQKLVGEVPELRDFICQEIRVLDDRISAEVDLLEKKQAMEELWKERRSIEVEEWRDTVVAGSGSYFEGSSWVSKLPSGG